jgi:SlyX protein
MEIRVTDLEVRYTHQERLIEELSSVINVQRLALDALERRVRDLEARLSSVEEPHENAPPPHY